MEQVLCFQIQNEASGPHKCPRHFQFHVPEDPQHLSFHLCLSPSFYSLHQWRPDATRKISPLRNTLLPVSSSFTLFLFYNFILHYVNLISYHLMFHPADGLKYYDLIQGNGPVAEKGTTVQVCVVSF